MIKDYTRFERNGLTVEVNYDEQSKPCKSIKFSIGSETAVIPNADLYAMMMIFGTPEQQEVLIPTMETKVRMVTSRLSIKAKKDIKKGQTIRVNHTYPVAADTYEKIKLEGGSGNSKLDKDIFKVSSVAPSDSDGEVVS